MKRLTAILIAALISLPTTPWMAGAAMAGEGSGSFSGASGHKTTGQVAVVKTADGWEVHLKENFTFDGAPDPRVGFGTSGKFAAATDFEPLKSNAGAQIYKVPADIDPAAFDEVYIWCRQYSVPLGVAQITN
jgi:hypothetical protein